MSSMAYCVCTRGWEGWRQCMQTWDDTASINHHAVICMDQDVIPAMQFCYEQTKEPILAYMHDDFRILEDNWDRRILKEFEDEFVGMVVVAGARGHGVRHLYDTPYRLPNLARQNFMSNLVDAEVHGERFSGERDVVVGDGMALFVRRTVLDRWGGWPVHEPYGYWLYSEALCCETRRQGLRIRLVGIKCQHLGGKSSGHIATSPTYEEAHRWLFEKNRDVLPAWVE
jgi:hypothetical protein